MKKAGDLVQGFFETFGIHDEKNYSGFMLAWKDIIGERLASHSRPMDIRQGTLVIAVDHPGWMMHIRMAERETLRNIRKRFPQLGVELLTFQLVDRLPTPQSGRKIIETAVSDPIFPPDIPKVSTEEKNFSGGPASPVEDKAPLFSALGKLKEAMEKRNGSAGGGD